MAMSWIYDVEIRHEENGMFGAYASAMPAAIASGGTAEEALAEMALALDAAVRGCIHFEMDLTPPPRSDRTEEMHIIVLAPELAAKASVYSLWRASGISKSDLAERLGIKAKKARRILDPNHTTSLKNLSRAARLFGYCLVVGALPS